MRTFKDFKGAFNWAEQNVRKGIEEATEAIAEQVYKDSNEFTYRETGAMYQSGEAYSNFKEGLVVERSPYVRRRYYEGGKPGANNKKAQPRWFEKTVAKYKDDYKTMFASALNKRIKG